MLQFELLKRALEGNPFCCEKRTMLLKWNPAIGRGWLTVACLSSWWFKAAKSQRILVTIQRASFETCMNWIGTRFTFPQFGTGAQNSKMDMQHVRGCTSSSQSPTRNSQEICDDRIILANIHWWTCQLQARQGLPRFFSLFLMRGLTSTTCPHQGRV